MNPLVLTVSQVNTYLKSVVDGDQNLRQIFVAGEISNFTNHIRSGHFYFSLKDQNSVLKAVMFKTSNRHLRFLPQDGMRVIVAGRISVFERDGVYQLYAEDMQPDGLGALYLAYEQLKKRLEQEGLFDLSRKKVLPRFPGKVGVVTSPTGAAIRDIQTIISRRYPLAELVLCPVLVQGEGAARQIADAIRLFNSHLAADVLIVGRGGGSLEDLWAFNEEQVVRAVADSQIPIISAVGHETDYTLCDFAADLRAPTPSAAAELAVPDSWELDAAIQKDIIRIKTAIYHLIAFQKNRLADLKCRPCLSRPITSVESKKQELDILIENLIRYFQTVVTNRKQQLSQACKALHSLSPLAVLGRGYAIATKMGKAVSSVDQIQEGDRLRLRFTDGEAFCQVEERTRKEELI